MTNSGFIGVDLFAGAGGLSYGLSRAGFNMKLGIEIDPNCAKTLGMNHRNMTVIVSDIRSVEPTEALKCAGIRKGELTIIVGGPPCRGFSQSNRRTRDLENPLNHLYKEFFRFVEELRPTVFLLENVEGLRTMHSGVIVQDILRLGEKYGYHVHWSVVNAENYGLPQRRKRIIFIGTFTRPANPLDVEHTEVTTVRQAIDDLPILENGNRVDLLEYSRSNNLSDYQKMMREKNGRKARNNLVTQNSALVLERYKYVPPGGNWVDIPNRLMYNYRNLRNCHRWIYHRLKWDDSSIAISNFRKNMLIHPEQDRGLSVREAARLQSFPDHYVFYGPLGSQQQQVANAVPPLLAQQIGSNVIQNIREM